VVVGVDQTLHHVENPFVRRTQRPWVAEQLIDRIGDAVRPPGHRRQRTRPEAVQLRFVVGQEPTDVVIAEAVQAKGGAFPVAARDRALDVVHPAEPRRRAVNRVDHQRHPLRRWQPDHRPQRTLHQLAAVSLETAVRAHAARYVRVVTEAVQRLRDPSPVLVADGIVDVGVELGRCPRRRLLDRLLSLEEPAAGEQPVDGAVAGPALDRQQPLRLVRGSLRCRRGALGFRLVPRRFRRGQRRHDSKLTRAPSVGVGRGLWSDHA